MKIEAVRGPAGLQIQAFDAATLFEQAGVDLRADRFAQAAAAYDRLLREFPSSRYVPSSLYNAGLAYEGLRRYDEAADRYRRFLLAQPDGSDALDARFRLGLCYAEAGRWAESEAVFRELLGRSDLSLPDRIEATARRGLAELEQGLLDAAERTFADVVTTFRQQQAAAQLDTDYFVAMAQFYLAHIPHRRFRSLPVRGPQRQLEQDVEAKAQAFLVAQGRYIETIRLQNPVWAAAAGYQIGMLYREMYDALLNAPLPEELDTEEKRKIYRDLLQDRLRVLLERAKRIHQKNIALAERLGVEGDWVRRSGEQLEELERLLGGEGSAGQASQQVSRPPPLPSVRGARRPPTGPPPPVL